MDVVIGKFELQRGRVPGGPILVPAALDEEIPVGLALGAEGEARRPADDRAGESPFRAVAIGPDAPVAALHPAEQRGLQPETLDVAVLPDQGRVEVRVFVLSIAGESFSRNLEDDRPDQAVPLDGRLEGPERTSAQPDAPAVLVEQQRPLAVQMDGCAGGILLRRLQPLGFLSVIQRDHSDTIGRKPAQVHLHVLGVVHLDPVQEDAHMLAAEAPDIDGLESAHSPVVLDLHAGEPAEDVGHLGGRRRGGREVHLLGGPHDRENLDGPDRGRGKRIRLLGLQAPGGGQDES